MSEYSWMSFACPVCKYEGQHGFIDAFGGDPVSIVLKMPVTPSDRKGHRGKVHPIVCPKCGVIRAPDIELDGSL